MLSKALIGLIRIYQRYISPLFPPRCRFQPSCSQYALESIRNCGPLKGCFYAAVRLLKCHPLHPGGHDPPPQKSPGKSAD
ncbi:membrane protein insertion efficiency factor YidD [Rhodopirellula sp. MGV]|uniref:membrane protein insertion efficiency factor YidD n=1 Tax=Rhodopirellula sp. MGV TaxID=2023130 RepID=UPI000B975B69|nr:membrane protein insertion efficiency factor YidD [Rhodopirellula sp. MGV]OYP37086.1 membrane protein insertion efficiency factor YidD [Rhodopirellula sp. MGV]PNY36299.1 membrane protein insertion efficiency factor YidD [Rhodopirellula baltica]